MNQNPGIHVLNPNRSGLSKISDELLNMFVSFKSVSKNNSVLVASNNVLNQTNTNGRVIDYIPVKTYEDLNGNEVEYLTTNYLNSHGVNSTTDLTNPLNKFNSSENLGITSIDIEYGSNLVPQVKMSFIDLRGAAIFNYLPDTPLDERYSDFFKFPYPVFELIVKGYYGQPIKYCLHLLKMNVSFNDTTGSFEIICDFVGYTFAFFRDLPINMIMSITGNRGYNNLKNIYNRMGSLDRYKPKIKNTQDIIDLTNPDNQLTLEGLLGRINNIEDDLKPIKKNVDAGKYIELTKIKKYIIDLKESIGVLNPTPIRTHNGIVLNNQVNNKVNTRFLDTIIVKISNDLKAEVTTFGDDITDEIKDLITEYNNIIDTNKLNNLTNSNGDNINTPQSITDISETIKNLFKQINSIKLVNGIIVENTTINGTQITSEEASIINNNLNLVNNGVNNIVYTIEYNQIVNNFYNNLLTIEDDINNAIDEYRSKVNNIVSKEITSLLGFAPTFNNIFKIITANVQAFVEEVHKVAKIAEGYESNRSNAFMVPLKNKSGLTQEVKPFPRIIKTNNTNQPTNVLNQNNLNVSGTGGTKIEFEYSWPGAGIYDNSSDKIIKTESIGLFPEAQLVIDTVNNYSNYNSNSSKNIKSKSDAETNKLNNVSINDPDLLKTVYNFYRNFFIKWVDGSDESDIFNTPCYASFENEAFLFDSFGFIDRMWRDIGDDLIVNLEHLKLMLSGTNTKQDLLSLVSNIFDKNNLVGMTLPGYYGFESVSDDLVEKVFQPDTAINSIVSGPMMLGIFNANANSKFVSTNSNINSRHNDDVLNIKNFGLDSVKPSRYRQLDRVLGFEVTIGNPNQQFFKNLNITTSNITETQESLTQISKMVDNNINENSIKWKGNDLYQVAEVRSYEAELETMGNMCIQPLMYFQLSNVPLFSGGYLITNVKHKITPNHIMTSFKGIRQSIVQAPITKEPLLSINFNLDNFLDINE